MKSDFDYHSYNERECNIHNRAFYLGEQHQQSKIDELQKRVDAALKILSSKKKMYVDMVIEIEQALKGG